jgi:hypothetical protein
MYWSGGNLGFQIGTQIIYFVKNQLRIIHTMEYLNIKKLSNNRALFHAGLHFGICLPPLRYNVPILTG